LATQSSTTKSHRLVEENPLHIVQLVLEYASVVVVSNLQWVLLMISFLIGLFLFALDNTIVADVQPAIVDQFQSVDKISWLATGFFMAAAGIYDL
jgi:hypothetical protein